MRVKKHTRRLPLKLGLMASIALGGCLATTPHLMRVETAQRIAAPAWMIKRDIPADPFLLRAYERIHERGRVAHLYIEGDGARLTSPSEWTNDPTPKNPLALHLASKDKADNVLYLARPCQFTGLIDAAADCSSEFSRSKSFAPEVLNAYNIALDDMARRYNLRGFHLIGYDGGAAIASLLAAQRKDILSLRTVAGVIDHTAQSNALGVEPRGESLDPVDSAPRLAHIPQYHFVGGQDELAPPAVLHSYLQALPPTRCVRTMLVQEAAHEDGWVEKWPELLKEPVNCFNGAPIETFDDFIPAPAPKTIAPEKPEKP